MTKPGLPLLQGVILHSIPGGNGCQLWVGNRNAQGYGRIRVNGRLLSVHRAVWEDAYGPIPQGLEIDHLCRNRACVTLRHMEAVTHAENVRRGQSGERQRAITHCPQGHLYDLANTKYTGRGRRCRACSRIQALRHYREAKVIPTWYSETRICEQCGASFNPKKPWQRFCVDACKEVARHLRRQGQERVNGKPTDAVHELSQEAPP